MGAQDVGKKIHCLMGAVGEGDMGDAHMHRAFEHACWTWPFLQCSLLWGDPFETQLFPHYTTNGVGIFLAF